MTSIKEYKYDPSNPMEFFSTFVKENTKEMSEDEYFSFLNAMVQHAATVAYVEAIAVARKAGSDNDAQRQRLNAKKEALSELLQNVANACDEVFIKSPSASFIKATTNA